MKMKKKVTAVKHKPAGLQSRGLKSTSQKQIPVHWLRQAGD